ncbi:MAG: ExeA family protein [Paracoccaceae bacterium]
MARPVLYTSFFGLTERPFTLQPDPSFIFWSEQHKRAFSILEFGILSNAPITLITGEIGAGKTTLLRALLEKMETEVTIGLVSNAQGSRGELLQWVLNALGVEIGAREPYVRLFQKLQDFIIGEYAAGRRVILIFDEAQNLSIEGLEELRLLTNINSGKDELVQLILVGQPELRDLVLHPNMRQLAQRITASFHLTPMDLDVTKHYIAHRLMHVGGTGQEFTPEAIVEIHHATGGIPRLVNQLCEFCMLYAWSAETRTITAQTVESVLKDGVFFGAKALPATEKPGRSGQGEDCLT